MVDPGGTREDVDLASVARLYAVLGSAADRILAAQDRGEIFDAVCQVLTDPGDFHLAWIALLQPDGGLVPVARAGVPSSYVTRQGEGRTSRAVLALSAIDNNDTVLVEDMWAGPDTEQWDDMRRHYGVRSACSVPIRMDGEPIAVLNTYMADGHPFDRARVQLVERLAEGVSYAMRALADRQARHQAHQVATASENELAARSQMHAELARIGQLAFTTDSLDALYAEITETVRRVMGLDLVVMEELVRGAELHLLASSGSADALTTDRPVPLDRRSFASRLLRDGDALAVADFRASTPPMALTFDDDLRAAAGVVVRSRHRAHGVLIAASRRPRLFPPVDIDFLRSLAHIVGAAIDHNAANRLLVEQALHDPLTGLPNRTLLYERLEQAATTLRPGRHLAVLLVDLDGFKVVNDALGHDVGDQLLKAVAERISSTVREGDLVARLGGDEFAVLCDDVSGLDAATEVADRLAEAMVAPFDIEPVHTYVTASIGITLHDGHDIEPRALLRDADVAMYVAKEEGRARYQVYDDAMHRSTVSRLHLTNDLRRALDEGQFELVWHPIVSLTGTCGLGFNRVCLEALLRWHHPERGLMPPDAFIGVAEDTGLIAPIGEWVMRAACRQLAEWRSAGGPGCPDMVSINLSAQQLARPEIVSTVRAVLDAEGIEPSSVVLEVTETAFMRDEERALSRLGELRRSGFIISIDDFGTGYSSLAYLRDLPARGLKIDRSFIARLGNGGSDHAIVESIVNLGHAVDLVVVAEGVETEAQRDALRAMGCDRAQGYLWTRPLAAADVPAWVERYRADAERTQADRSEADRAELTALAGAAPRG